MFSGAHIVITGGSGFIGSFLAEELLRRGATVRVPLHGGDKGFLKETGGIEWMEGDLRDDAFCISLLEGAHRLFHFASRRKNVAVHRQRAGEIAADNIRMSLALAKAVSTHPVPVTFMSSATVPEPLSLLSVSAASETDGYALGKAASEMVWIAASRQYGFLLAIPRPVGIYGPRDTFSQEGNIIPSLMVKAESATDALDVWGSGDAVRSFLFVEDVIRALFILAEADVTGIQFIVPPETVTVRALAERIRDLVRPGLPLRFDSAKPEGALSPVFPPPHPLLQGFAWTPLAAGLQRTLDWWKGAR
ncbi:MAG: NAD(P)-dependent oxidoreductase [Candidatus Peribacteraceae bacterium]|jgi:UDP-glucose 4-epimerase